MSGQNLEARVAAMEKRATELEEALRELATASAAASAQSVVSVAALADAQKSNSVLFFKTILAMSDANRSAFEVLQYGLPNEELRKGFDRMLGKVLSQRDHLEGLIQGYANQPPPSSR
jgi:hypothetical protein